METPTASAPSTKRVRYTKKLHQYAVEKVLPVIIPWASRRAMMRPWKLARYDRRNPLIIPNLA